MNYFKSALEICKFLLVLNKIDLEKERKVSNEDITSFINNINGTSINLNEKNEKIEQNNIIEKIEISVENKNNLENLWEKVYQIINRKENIRIPINSIKERINYSNWKDKVSELFQADGIINIVLMGDSGVGKSNVLSRYFNNKFVRTFISTIGVDKKTKIIKYKKLYIM